MIFNRQMTKSLSRSIFTAAYKVNDFEAVSVFQGRLGPAVAGDDVAVEFYGYAVGLHGQGFDQLCEGRRCIGEVAVVSVDLKLHGKLDRIIFDRSKNYRCFVGAGERFCITKLAEKGRRKRGLLTG
jgi:hypothetical protein